jgi:Uroporphyrinogen decarboxylase (URO-D)
MYPAEAMKTLGIKWFKWAGHGLSDNVMYQYQDGEYMTAKEYDEFLYDPSHFMTTKWLPRSFKGLEGLSNFPAMRMNMWFGWTGIMPAIADPSVQEALKIAIKGGEQINEWFASLGQYADEIKAKGFPQAYGTLNWAPFDIIGDTLRGAMGVYTDMIRHPDKLLEAIEKAVPISIDYGAGAAGADLPFCWIWLHKGSDGSMSVEQYGKFYWPSLKKVIEGLIKKDITPVIYCEGDENSRLEFFQEVPKGKVIFHFSIMDMARAKEMLGDTACIMGNIPNSLMFSGTPDDIKAYCKKLIDTAGKNGGYIMDTSSLLDEAKPENVKMMYEFTREYGCY